MRVLFVDDDAMNRRVVRDMLSVVGVETDEADSGASGVSQVGRIDYDLILMDLRMPGMDGLEAIRLIRAMCSSKANVPIAVVTADTAPDLRARCLKEGADDLLHKPVAMDALYEIVGRLVSTSGDPSAGLP